MTKKLKQLTRIGILTLTISLLTIGCQKDEPSVPVEQTQQESPFTIKHINRDQIFGNTKIVQKIEKITKGKTKNKKDGINNRTVHSEEYGFSIDTDRAIYMENQDGSYHSYTFLVERDGEQTGLENLLLSLQENGTYKAQLIEYDFEFDAADGFQEALSNNLDKVYSTPIDANGIVSGLTSKSTMSGVCIWIEYTWCAEGNHPGGWESDGSACPAHQSQSILFECFSSGGDGSSSGTGNSTTTTGDGETDGTTGGTGGTNDGTTSGTNDATTPVLPLTMAQKFIAVTGITLTPEQEVWANKAQNEEIVQQVMDFVFINCGQDNSSNSCVDALETANDFLKITEGIPNAKFDRYKELDSLIQTNPWALIQDCAEQNGMDTSNYIDLYNHTIPQECTDRLNTLNQTNPGYFNQPISMGNVPCANIDYYGVEITNYPDFNNDGNPDTEAEIYQAFREKFTDLASGEQNGFQFSCNIPFNSTNTGDISWDFIPLTPQDGVDFVSNNPIASILKIEADASGLLPTIATDDGAIIVSDFTSNDWTISTIGTPENGFQPFSGNRQWGWIINQNGNFEFFTRAVDVANISMLLNVGANTECQQETYYDIAEATWQNLQQEIADWINDDEISHGGQAVINAPKAIHVDKEKIIEILTTNESIDQVLSNCN